jgi:hypothetical protein
MDPECSRFWGRKLCRTLSNGLGFRGWDKRIQEKGSRRRTEFGKVRLKKCVVVHMKSCVVDCTSIEQPTESSRFPIDTILRFEAFKETISARTFVSHIPPQLSEGYRAPADVRTNTICSALPRPLRHSPLHCYARVRDWQYRGTLATPDFRMWTSGSYDARGEIG